MTSHEGYSLWLAPLAVDAAQGYFLLSIIAQMSSKDST